MRTTTDKPDKPFFPFFSNNGINALINCETTSSYHVPFDPIQSNRIINTSLFRRLVERKFLFGKKGKISICIPNE